MTGPDDPSELFDVQVQQLAGPILLVEEMNMGGVTARLARVATKRTCRLTHHGRRSGRPFEVTVWFLVDADIIYLTTMNMKRQWTQNVQVNRDVTLRIGSETFAGEASVVAEPSEIAGVVSLLKEKYWIARPYLWLKKQPDGVFRVRFKS
jgi:deazaflavin-dependent oxidoreductase (nitroreductase family)